MNHGTRRRVSAVPARSSPPRRPRRDRNWSAAEDDFFAPATTARRTTRDAPCDPRRRAKHVCASDLHWKSTSVRSNLIHRIRYRRFSFSLEVTRSAVCLFRGVKSAGLTIVRQSRSRRASRVSFLLLTFALSDALLPVSSTLRRVSLENIDTRFHLRARAKGLRKVSIPQAKEIIINDPKRIRRMVQRGGKGTEIKSRRHSAQNSAGWRKEGNNFATRERERSPTGQGLTSTRVEPSS